MPRGKYLYWVNRTDSVGYDEYSDMVIIADSPAEAKRLFQEKQGDDYNKTATEHLEYRNIGHRNPNFHAYDTEWQGRNKPFKKVPSRIVCASYHAG